MNIKALNEAFKPMLAEERIREFYRMFDAEKVLLTSSFGTNSVYLLHLISKVNRRQKVHFINTNYLFEETIKYKNDIARDFTLEVIEARPDPTSHAITREEKTYKSNPDLCCGVNKVATLNSVLDDYNVWMAGVMNTQTDTRKDFDIFQIVHNKLKFMPLADYSELEVQFYIKSLYLPPHPLKAQGYGSVGCTHCTSCGYDREGRWAGQSKTECGLHTLDGERRTAKGGRQTKIEEVDLVIL